MTVAHGAVFRALSRLVLLTAFWGASSGCATVLPHERGDLARPGMTLGAGWAADQHAVHASRNREGAALADGATGGGCGCN